MKIICPRDQMLKFRRECRKRFPNEHFAAIYGLRSDEGNFLITRIAPVEYKSTTGNAEPARGSIMRSKRAALRNDAEWLGTIHSHPTLVNDESCQHLSDMDIRTALQWGESICGIVYVFEEGTRTSIHWYVPSPLPEVTYD